MASFQAEAHFLQQQLLLQEQVLAAGRDSFLGPFFLRSLFLHFVFIVYLSWDT